MPKVKNLFSDYNGTLDPRYLEIALAYELLNYHKEQGNKMRYIDLLANRQARLLFGFLAGGKQKLIEPYVNGFLSGEEKTVIDSAARRLSKRDTKMPAVVKRLIGEEKIFGKPYPEAKQLFNKAKEIGIKTGIYTRSLLDIIMPALNDEGLLCYFDYVVGNKISYKNSIVTGLEENVANGKKGLYKHLLSVGLEPRETAFIDDEDIEPLTEVGTGIASPNSKSRFKYKCKEKGIYTPNSWDEVAEILEIKLD